MQQKWDDLDKIIAEAITEIEVDEKYNEELLNKIYKAKENKEQSYIVAFSLIMAGFLAIFLYTSNVQYKLIEMRTIAKSHILSIEYNYNRFDIIKYIRGE